MRKHIWKKQTAVFVLFAVILSALPSAVYAKTTSEKIKEAEREKQETEGKLSETEGRLNGLRNSKMQLQDKLSELNENLEKISKRLSELESQLTEKEEQIEKKTQELSEVIEEMDTQYAYMKVRIKRMYEKGDSSYEELFFANANFGDFLNRATYIEKVNEYDQKMLEKLTELKEETARRKAELEEEEAELQKLREEASKEQEKVQGLIDDTSSSISGYSGQISATEQEALLYETAIHAKENDIATLKVQLEKEKEIARRAAQMRKKDLSEINIDVSDRELLACLIQCEADGEPWEGKIAVGSVVLNRARSGVYPDTIVGVIYQSGQFAPVASGRLAMRLAAGANETCLRAADEVLAGANNIGDCLFFRTVIPEIQGTIIGNHVFY
ncbi:cell wall hydrolase [bacterium C-53]|nr:cell wall hydrolase [Lachnospiraceae bacterium]NBI04304.1 cell wall hydrolase [Lachnospiraceae bacterium]RKJ08473.1 cell wall hydrolase [bacterium C-53]